MNEASDNNALRHKSFLDRVILEVDHALKTIAPQTRNNSRPTPTPIESSQPLDDCETNHSAGLMRVNHTGEVCAQALYQGQALTASLPDVREEMKLAAEEEIDHLAWCENRLTELNSSPSVLNPFWYSSSFVLGAMAGLISDKVSLGFVAATEEQVCEHLEGHLQSLPEKDLKSRTIVTQMLEDERKHGHSALAAGGIEFPKPIKSAMTLVSKVMTTISYKV
ncbi:2-polyprenyl-3-methyl-6-methoxy-1,4-benzoquinone monooxygenase [Aurantivibrio infirmus]